MFDSVMVPCPRCGEPFEAQSKSGDCVLDTFPLDKAPTEVLAGANALAPFVCAECGTRFQLRLRITADVEYLGNSELDREIWRVRHDDPDEL